MWPRLLQGAARSARRRGGRRGLHRHLEDPGQPGWRGPRGHRPGPVQQRRAVRELAGWSLAGFPDGSWKNTTLAGQSAKSRTGVRWYRTSARLDLPQGQDNAIALDLAEAEGEARGRRHRLPRADLRQRLADRPLPAGHRTADTVRHPQGHPARAGRQHHRPGGVVHRGRSGPGFREARRPRRHGGRDQARYGDRALVRRQDVRHAGRGRPGHRRRRAVPEHRHRRQGPRHPQCAEGRAARPERRAGAEGPGRLDRDHRRHHPIRPAPARRHGDRTIPSPRPPTRSTTPSCRRPPSSPSPAVRAPSPV